MKNPPKYLSRSGLFSGQRGIAPIVRQSLLLSAGAKVELESAGAKVELGSAGAKVELGSAGAKVELGKRMPAGIIAAMITNSGRVSLRLESEPPQPGEQPDEWLQLDWTPCPKCGAPLVWYEAGYVPGYRVCAKKPHHHVQG